MRYVEAAALADTYDVVAIGSGFGSLFFRSSSYQICALADIRHHGLGEGRNQRAVLFFLTATDPLPSLIPICDGRAEQHTYKWPERGPNCHSSG